MTSDLTTPTAGHRGRLAQVPVVPIAVGAVALSRLLFLARPATPDEGGFLMVASQWHVGGTSLYGDYWVDRPPLLIGIFRHRGPRRRPGFTSADRRPRGSRDRVLLLASTARRTFGRAGGRS